MELIGLKVQISLSDPWEVLDSWKPDQLIGTVTDYKECKEEISVCLGQIISHNQQNYQYVIASPRYVNTSFSGFQSGTNITCGLIFVPTDRNIQGYRTEDWRGQNDGLAAIGVLIHL